MRAGCPNDSIKMARKWPKYGNNIQRGGKRWPEFDKKNIRRWSEDG